MSYQQQGEQPAIGGVGPIRTDRAALNTYAHPTPYPLPPSTPRVSSSTSSPHGSFYGYLPPSPAVASSFTDLAPAANTAAMYNASQTAVSTNPNAQSNHTSATNVLLHVGPPSSNTPSGPDPSQTANIADKDARMRQLEVDHLAVLHEFSRQLHAEQMQRLMSHVLSVERHLVSQDIRLDVTDKNLGDILQYVQGGWRMSSAQEDIMKGVVCHWLVKAVLRYGKEVKASIQKYITANAKKLKVAKYTTDKLVQQVVNDFIHKYLNQQRGNLAKSVFKYVKEETNVKFVSRMLTQWSLDTNIVPSQAVLAQFAMLRLVARDIILERAEKPVLARTPTGFFDRVHKKLAEAAKENGKNRDSERWKQWNETQIAEEKVTIGNGMSQGLDGEPDEGGDAGTDAEDE